MRYLGPDYPIYAVQAHGLAKPEPLPVSIEQMAADYVDKICAVQPAGPYCLLGWSFGGLVAHAMATELQQRGEQTALLAILDAYPAHDLPENLSMLDKGTILARMIRIFNDDPGIMDNQSLTPAQALELLHSWGVALAGANENHLEAAVDIAINNDRLMHSFTPRRFQGDLLLFIPTIHQPEDRPAPDAWRPYVGGTIETYTVSTEHDHMTRPGSLAQIGPILAVKLNEINGSTRVGVHPDLLGRGMLYGNI